MQNIVWLTKQEPCVVCGWQTYTSLDGEHHVCNDLTCISLFREASKSMNQEPEYENALVSQEIKEHIRDYHSVIAQ